MFAQKRSKPGHVTQFAAQRFFASDVNTAVAAQPVLPAHQQRILAIGLQDRVRRGPRHEAHVAAQRRRALHAHAVQNLGLLHDLRLDGLLHRRDAGVLLHVAQQDLLQARKGRSGSTTLPCADVRHLLQKRAVHVLPQPDRRDGDVVGHAPPRVSAMLSPSSEMPSVSSTMCL